MLLVKDSASYGTAYNSYIRHMVDEIANYILSDIILIIF